MNPALRDLLLYAPTWVLPGASVDLDFQNSRYYQTGSGGGPLNLITTSRASTAYADDTSGNWSSFASNLPRITNKGLLVEEARTNSIRNNSMQGAVAGTPGTAPTNWVINNNVGLTTSIVGTSTVNGIDCVDIRYSGTASGSGVIGSGFESAAQITASNTQVWSQSVFYAIVGGSLTNTGTLNAGIDENTGAGSFVRQDATSQSAMTSTLRRASNIVTLSGGATVGAINCWLRLNVSGAGAVDITIRFGWPQLELGAFATSPIRTTNAAVTRAADVVTLTKVPTFGSNQTLFFKGTPNAPTTYGTFQGAIIAHDGTTNDNRIQIIRNTANGKINFVTGGATVVGLNTDASVIAQNSSFRAALAVTSGSVAYSDSGGSSGTSNTTDVPAGSTLTTVRVGDQNASRQLDGYVERIAIWPSTRLSNSDLQKIII